MAQAARAASASSSAAVRRPLRIGMVGGGTVGGGVHEIIMNRLSHQCVITNICVRNLNKPRTFHLTSLPASAGGAAAGTSSGSVETVTQLTTDVDSILNDDTIDIVIEVMGGTTLARTVVLDALAKGKSVVTANKALVAQHLFELQEASERSKGILSYEAAVCGGIPIISALQTCYAGDVIHQVMGICNGTTNFMLGKMEEDNNADYDAVLREAQDLGYAEADPTADVEGHDVCAKICILAKLAFGVIVDPTKVPCQGITQVTAIDFEYAKLMGCTVKLVGAAVRLSNYGEHDGALSVYVAPHVVANTHLLAAARGSGNAVAITSANMGTTSYTGPGAGRYPTANSIVADVMRICNELAPSNPFPTPAVQQQQSSSTSTTPIDVDYDYSSAYYIRIPFIDSLGIIRKIGELAEKHGVSIHSILQNPIRDRTQADFVITTEECKRSQADALCEDIDKEGFTRSYPLCMPLLMDLL